ALLLALRHALFHPAAIGVVRQGAGAATDAARRVPERADVAEKLGGAAVATHHIDLVIANLDAGAGHHLHRQLVGRHFLAVPVDPEVVRPLVGRGCERGITPDRHAEDFTEVGVVGDAPTLRVVGNADPHRHDVQNGLHLIDPALQLLVEAADLLL